MVHSNAMESVGGVGSVGSVGNVGSFGKKYGVAEVRYEIQLVVNFKPKQECKLYLFLHKQVTEKLLSTY